MCIRDRYMASLSKPILLSLENRACLLILAIYCSQFVDKLYHLDPITLTSDLLKGSKEVTSVESVFEFIDDCYHILKYQNANMAPFIRQIIQKHTLAKLLITYSKDDYRTYEILYHLSYLGLEDYVLNCLSNANFLERLISNLNVNNIGWLVYAVGKSKGVSQYLPKVIDKFLTSDVTQLNYPLGFKQLLEGFDIAFTGGSLAQHFKEPTVKQLRRVKEVVFSLRSDLPSKRMSEYIGKLKLASPELRNII
eukprot:TRINITY_DN10393_c0_g1_i2.p1 TRINITY_DN10393_c0_g1~~TRINITY_DN10393_c0_g1_i2.p1  ORF type:complete len:251 (+),score=6.57 TRINITY_DN10393_c0_g1_i2:65-817(+)